MIIDRELSIQKMKSLKRCVVCLEIKTDIIFVCFECDTCQFRHFFCEGCCEYGDQRINYCGGCTQMKDLDITLFYLKNHWYI